MTPARAVRVVDGDTWSVLLSLDPAEALVTLTSAEVSITLTPKAATALGFDLVEAAEAPERCLHCERYAVADDLCDLHALALDRSREAMS